MQVAVSETETVAIVPPAAAVESRWEEGRGVESRWEEGRGVASQWEDERSVEARRDGGGGGSDAIY